MNDFFHKKLGIPAAKSVLCLAPMEGITNHIFRSAILKNGAPDIVATEFIRISSANQRVKPFKRHQCPLQIQIMGCSPEIIAGNMEFLKERGVVHDDDWIDLNVGCPSKRVNSHGSGAALLKTPNVLVSIIQGLRDKHSGPLSIKTRIGFESEQDFPEILSALKDCPLDFISIHARTKQAGYEPGVNLKQLRLAVETLPYPVIGNGDVWEETAAVKMLTETGVRGLMIGRGIARDPFLFKKLKQLFAGQPTNEYTSSDYLTFALSLLVEYAQLEQLKKKPNSYVGVFKEFSVWLSKNPVVGSQYFQSIKRCRSLSEISNLIQSQVPGISTDASMR